MYLLDTDHISLIGRGGEEGQRIIQRIANLPQDQVSVCIVNYEEQMRGWLAEIAATNSVNKQLSKYAELARMLRYYCRMPILPFEEEALSQFQKLWLLRVRVGTMDLKIASIALANDATVLTRNLKDFGKISGLKVEDWSL